MLIFRQFRHVLLWRSQPRADGHARIGCLRISRRVMREHGGSDGVAAAALPRAKVAVFMIIARRRRAAATIRHRDHSAENQAQDNRALHLFSSGAATAAACFESTYIDRWMSFSHSSAWFFRDLSDFDVEDCRLCRIGSRSLVLTIRPKRRIKHAQGYLVCGGGNDRG